MDEEEREIQTNNTHAGYSSLALTLSLRVYAYTYTSARIRIRSYARLVTCVLCACARALLRLESEEGESTEEERVGRRDTKTRRISGGARTAHPEFNNNFECLATATSAAALVILTLGVSEITACVASALQFHCASSQASLSRRLTLRHAGVSLATNASRRHRHHGG